MKNLILFFVLSPLFCLSQTLIDNVSIMSFLNTKKDFHKSTEVLSNMNIYVDSGYLYIKDDIETLKYKIEGEYDIEINGEQTNGYEITIDKKPHLAYVVYYEKSKALKIENRSNDDITLFYEKRG